MSTPTRRLRVIGIGMGDPEQVTGQAAAALAGADVVFTVDKPGGARDLTVLRERICARHGRPDLRVVAVEEPARDRDPADYAAEVRRWHDARAQVWEQALLAHEGVGAFLAWGDPSLYDSTLRILDTIAARGRVRLEIDVIPGVTSVQVLTAAHRILLNTVGGPVVLSTGRRLATDAAAAGPDATLVVMLDGGSAWAELDPDAWHVWWGAYLGGPEQILRAGPLRELSAPLAELKRTERARHGWIMDTYLLRRTDAG